MRRRIFDRSRLVGVARQSAQMLPEGEADRRNLRYRGRRRGSAAISPALLRRVTHQACCDYTDTPRNAADEQSPQFYRQRQGVRISLAPSQNPSSGMLSKARRNRAPRPDGHLASGVIRRPPTSTISPASSRRPSRATAHTPPATRIQSSALLRLPRCRFRRSAGAR